jgi:hypothetical protein
LRKAVADADRVELKQALDGMVAESLDAGLAVCRALSSVEPTLELCGGQRLRSEIHSFAEQASAAYQATSALIDKARAVRAAAKELEREKPK